MSADGIALSSMADFVKATKDHKLSPVDYLLNDTARTYYMLGTMLKGRGEEDVVQNGQNIIDITRLTKHTAAGFYRPGQNSTPVHTDLLTKISAPWRFHQGNYSWNEEALDLNGKGDVDNYTNLAMAWRTGAEQDVWDSMENALWATPSTADMESADGLLPYSIPTFITTDGLAPAGFSTIEGVSPSTQVNWRNQTDTYTIGSLATTLFRSFDRLYRKLNWHGPKTPKEWYENTDFQKMVIVTDLNGCDQYTNLVRVQNDRMNDPGDFGATYKSLPLTEVPALTDAGDTNPNFRFIHTKHLHPVYHTDKYLKEKDPIHGGPTLPNSWVVYTFTTYNLFCNSRKRQGCISGA